MGCFALEGTVLGYCGCGQVTPNQSWHDIGHGITRHGMVLYAMAWCILLWLPPSSDYVKLIIGSDSQCNGALQHTIDHYNNCKCITK